jgi:hypothetical protein
MSDRKAKESAHPAPLSGEERFFKWADVAVKCVAALIGIAIAVIGHRYQQSLTASQLLTQRESGDTQIRAEMFKAITDRLIRPPKEGDVPPEQDALLAGLLALNFHEHIELKPLMVDLDDRLQKPGPPEREAWKRALRSIARRVRARQTAMLVDAKPASGEASPNSGRVRYFSVTREGQRGLRCSVPEEAGMSGCLRELMSDDLPDQKPGDLWSRLTGAGATRSMYLSVDEADWERERFTVSLGVGKRIEIDAETLASATEAEDCREGADGEKGEEIDPDVSAYNQTFVVTWFDFPLTDNTLLADGTRFSVFIDQVCRDAQDEPQAARLGLLYFPKDYFASRERPTNYRQLREKLGLDVDD